MFLVAIGGVLVAADLRVIDPALIVEGLRLWPLAIVAIGLGLVLRRTRFSVPGGVLAAAVPGLLLGGGFAVAPRIAVDCGSLEAGAVTSDVATHQGVFDGPARVSVSSGCGRLEVGTASGTGWQLQAADGGSRPAPIIDASARSLSIATRRQGWHMGLDLGSDGGRGPTDLGRETWRLRLPTTPIEDLSFVVNAGEGRIGLPAAQVGHLDLTTNAGRTAVDLTGATVASVTGTVNAGLLSLTLPTAADLTGSVKVNAGGLEVCVPSGLGLRVHHTGALSGFSVDGVHQSGSDWESSGYASAAHHADLNVRVNLGNVEIDPIGGCK